MKFLIRILILFVFTASIFPQEQKPKVVDLKWIAGCWQMNDNGKITTERWSNPTSNLMLGTSQTVKDGKSTAFEFLRIVDNGHGPIYVAKPSDAKNETAFVAKKISINEAIFENPKHDFPQRIIYRLENKKSLFARIEGTKDGKEMGIDFPMKRVKCE